MRRQTVLVLRGGDRLGAGADVGVGCERGGWRVGAGAAGQVLWWAWRDGRICGGGFWTLHDRT